MKTIYEKEGLLCEHSQITDIVHNKFIYNKNYKPNLKTHSIGNVMNVCNANIFNKSKNKAMFDGDFFQRPLCKININTGDMIFTDINQTASYILELVSKNHTTITCDIHWQGYRSAHITACYMDFINKEYNYFDVNGGYNFSLYRERNTKRTPILEYNLNGYKKVQYLGRLRSNLNRSIKFNHQCAIKPMLLWIKAIIDEIYRLSSIRTKLGIKLKPGKYTFYKRKHGNIYGIRHDLPYIHDSPKELENGTCAFYCKWMDLLITKKKYTFEEARFHIASLTPDQRKLYITSLFNKIWNIYTKIKK